jgi:hypothetical protein
MDGKGGTGLLLIVSQWIIPENSRRLAQASLSRRKTDQQLQDMVDLKRKYAKKKIIIFAVCQDKNLVQWHVSGPCDNFTTTKHADENNTLVPTIYPPRTGQSFVVAGK